MGERKGRTVEIAGTAILAALAVILDYSLKFSGLKIEFPPARFLKFDFTGIPVVLALLLYGLSSGATTALVAGVAIMARSGDVVGASMKALAEFVTILGVAAVLRLGRGRGRAISVLGGVGLRVAAMAASNLVVLPLYYGMPFGVVVGLLPWIGSFNAVQGAMTVIIGYILYEAYVRRVPTHAPYAVAK